MKDFREREVNVKAIDGKYLTFALCGEEYGIPILQVKEIIGITSITRMPEMPDYVKGVINLRGKVIPVTDMRLRFDLVPMDYNERTCIIVVEVESGQAKVPVGLVVDAVSEVANVKEADIEETPHLGAASHIEYVSGLAKLQGNVKILLDINRIFSPETVNQLNS